jgi:hypothetical protein
MVVVVVVCVCVCVCVCVHIIYEIFFSKTSQVK